MNTEALKEQARRHEQREEWQKALDLYGQAVSQLAEEDQPDLALHNRLGDLEIRVGNIERAVEHYEQAIDLYLESELPNNAIAICRKIVCNLPTRHHIYLKMGQIRAKQGFLTDARQNFLEYAERMQKAEDMEEAFRALIEFVELAPDDLEARSALAAQLAAHERTAEAVEQYVAMHQQLSLAGQDDAAAEIEAKIQELDPAAEIPPPLSEEDDVMGFETTSLVADFPVFDTGADSEPVTGAQAELGEIQLPDDEGTPDGGSEEAATTGTDAGGLDLEYTVATGSFALNDEDTGDGVQGFVDETADLTVAVDEAAEPDVESLEGLEHDMPLLPGDEGPDESEPTADLLFGEAGDGELDESEPTADLLFGEAGDEEVSADSFQAETATSWEEEWSGADAASPGGAEDLLEDADEADALGDLPLLTFDDEPAAATDGVLAASDFGVQDDDWREDSEYVEETEELPELEADLADLEMSESDSREGDSEEHGPSSLEVEERSPLEAALRDEESFPAEAARADADRSDAPDEDIAPRVEDEPLVEAPLSEDAQAVEEFLAEEERMLEEALREEEPAVPMHDGTDPVLTLQERLEQDPDDAEAWLALAQAFFDRDRSTEAGMALDQAIDGFRSQNDLEGSIRAAQTLVDNDSDDVRHHQRLVELAIRHNDPEVLTPAYLGLAACLVRGGDETRAQGVYQQVLVGDPENRTAREGLAALAAAPGAPVQEVASSEDYVDLGSMVLDVEEERTTRWKVPAAEPSGDEEADFAKMLSQFKEKVAEHLEADDLAAHYDLGTAYKEMGLVDEAISEFQQALRAQADHLPTHELLGQCFMETEQYEVAVRSMNRAVEVGTEVEDELLGIYYQLARAHEELGNKDEALEFYEKVFALDINFQDVTERLRVLR